MSMFFRRMIAVVLCVTISLGTPLTTVTWGQQIEPGPSLPIITTEILLDEQQSVYEDLFDETYDPNEWTYPLDDEITGKGDYTGMTASGQTFTLRVLVATPVDLNDPDLDVTPQERQFAIDNGFGYTGVVGRLVTPLASIPVNGMAVSQSNATIPFDSRFVLVKKENPSSPVFNTRPFVAPTPSAPRGSAPVSLPVFSVAAGSACEDACADAFFATTDAAGADLISTANAAITQYENKYLDAQADLDLAVSNATMAFDIDYEAEGQLYALALVACTAALTAAHIACAFVTATTWWSLGTTTLLCVLAAEAAYAGCLAVASAAYAIELNRIKSIRDLAISTANTAFQMAVAEAAAARDATIAAAEEVYDAIVEQAGADYTVCIAACDD